VSCIGAVLGIEEKARGTLLQLQFRQEQEGFAESALADPLNASRLGNGGSIMRNLMTLFSLAICLVQSGYAKNFAGATPARVEKSPPGGVAVLWRQPDDIAIRDLLYGPGGKAHEPRGKFRFIEEDFSGSNPKFKVEDEQGVKWRVKLGKEAQPETSATRLLWAAGYFTDEDYYLPEMRVQGIKTLARGPNLVSANGTVRGARLERHVPGEKKIGGWSWFKNPFVGTREFNGLKVLMALINNADLKGDNNSIYDEEGLERRYVVGDLGATFGKTGSIVSQSIGNLPDYSDSKFIKRIRSEDVDFVMHSRPPFLFLLALPYYVGRARMQEIVKHIPCSDAKWIGGLLSQLSERQIQDAFRAGGFGPQQVDGYARVLRWRIAELNRL
jgi:hypothetical protein